MRVVLTFAGPGPDERFELLVGAVRVFGVDNSLQGARAGSREIRSEGQFAPPQRGSLSRVATGSDLGLDPGLDLEPGSTSF